MSYFNARLGLSVGSTPTNVIDPSGNITGLTIVKSGGTSSQFLKADGSVDSTTYATGTINAGTFGVAASTAGATNTNIALNLSAAWNANSATNVTINPVVGPAISALATFMTTATAGFIKRSGQDAYVIDTNTYIATGGQAGSVANAVTFNNGGAGAVSGTTFNGSSAITVSYNTIGAQVAGTYVTAIGVTTANGVSGSSSGGTTPSLTITLGAITPTSVASSGAISGTTASFTGTITNTTATGNGALINSTSLQSNRD